MTWKKYFQSVPAASKYQRLAARYANDPSSAPQPNSYSNRFSSWLPEVYSGQPNRVERYSQYDNMDLDVEINMALDTITDSCTQPNNRTGLPFNVDWLDGITEEETELILEMLRQWVSINQFDRHVWRSFRSILKFGDQFFIRDPDTFKLFWVDPAKVDSVIVDESKGKEPEQYIIRDLDANLESLVATGNLKRPADQRGYSSGPLAAGGYQGGAQFGQIGRQVGSRFNASASSAPGGTAGLAYYVDADHVIHFSMSEGQDNIWPFGVSILENVFKTFKQKELIEDAVIIYRVQRAPERRVFYIDTGRMPNHRAMAYLERIKNEIQQKRIPSRTGGQQSIIDATYNPMSMLEDYFFAQNSDGKGSRVETLPGGDQLGQIDDLRYFNHKLRTGLRVPRSYMPDFDDGGGAIFNDGRIGTAYIEELRFTKYCERLQNLISPGYDLEFKLFCKHRGINVHSSLFKLKFNEPQNFSKYRQTEVDGATLGVYTQVTEISHISKRFGLKRYLGWSEEEILENEKAWSEENAARVEEAEGSGIVPTGDEGTGFGDVGASAVGLEGGESPEELGDEEEGEMEPGLEGTESPISGAENAKEKADEEEEEL